MSRWRKHVSNDTNFMVELLISINNNIKKMSKTQSRYFKIAIISLSLLTAYSIIFLSFESEENILFSLTAFVTNVFHLIWIFITAYSYMKQKHIQNMINKEKTRLENLRLEMIDHLKNTWYINEHSAVRDEISMDLEEHDINVRHKS